MYIKSVRAATGCGGAAATPFGLYSQAALSAEVTNTFQCQVQPVKSLVINMRIN